MEIVALISHHKGPTPYCIGEGGLAGDSTDSFIYVSVDGRIGINNGRAA